MHNTVKKVKTSLLTLVFAFISTATLAANAPAKATGKVTIYEEITWERLMPPVDEGMVKKWEDGKLSREDVMDYMEVLGNTPVMKMDKTQVKIPGFLVPLNMDKNQVATELLLVPTMGSCIHVPPPPPNQTIYVHYPKGMKVTEAGYTPYWLEGTLKVEKNTSDYTDTLYGFSVTNIVEYE
ncbi:DUF3299 domain-containing protein [Sansalvadorimonas verongulae]|uniref:DUF3299 domain-containing protein n=1 Tax=Sansalvadorimonas verongulae TaxID=2172824 RepID=UPI0012BB70F7|nr:DUF3299 domain-containing protein [Sansalvadorimonas verongulae]MTI15352.1 DUF3299 domain-containing protein [Sansalvadorimonas verongulae]